MTVRELPIPGLRLIQLKVHGDARGFFVERFNEEQFRAAGLPVRFVQDNHSRSAPGVIRGLHYQYAPVQGKLVGVTRGRILDVAVDLRSGSPTFGQHFACELSDMNGLVLWIPEGFAHGFCVLGDEPADLNYKVDAPYNPACEGGLRWDDPRLSIPWPVANAVLSARDEKLGSFDDYCQRPRFEWRTSSMNDTHSEGVAMSVSRSGID
jgi:dTDP-4-dehydrorhamnose 3,5-epimerase